MTPYATEVESAMRWLANRPTQVVFVGQQTGIPGAATHAALANLPPEKRLEFPVAEELQMGFCIGLALEGYVPVCVYPRWNFILRAMDQLVNHLDALPLYSDFIPKVIVRTVAPKLYPLEPGPQHNRNFTGPVGDMLQTVEIRRAFSVEHVMACYKDAWESKYSSIVVESGDLM